MQNGSPDKRKPRSGRRNNNIVKRAPIGENSGVGRPVIGDLFYLSGEDIQAKPYPYTGCGLDNIFLINGYKITHHDGEEYVAITDIDGLHRAIGRHLVMHRKGLSPKEVRFVRKAMELTQAELAAKLGNDAQSVARWEKGICAMPGTAEKLFRVIYWAENITCDEDRVALERLLVSALSELDQIDEVEPAQAKFSLSEKWVEAPKLAA